MKYVPKAITRTAGRAVLKTKKSSPTLLFVAGVGGAVTATVLACRATLKAQSVMDESRKQMIEAEVLESRSQMNSTDAQQRRKEVTLKTAFELSKLYAPAVGVGVISIACLTKSHRQLTQRNAALTAAYVSLQNFLESYRGRVRQEIGEEKERGVYYASTPVVLAEDTPNGPKKIMGARPTSMSPYSAIFDETNGSWQESSEYNEHIIRLRERNMTDRLRHRGHLFLNEVYDALDLPRTPTGQECGWFIGHPNSDDFVEITIVPMHDFHQSLLLDFNVAGSVMDMLGE